MAEKYENLDLFDVLADALFITSNKINRSGITFDNSLKKGDLIVNGMSNQLEQVFINMIGNACDAMTDSEKRNLSIKASSTEWDNVPCWRIEFSDTGKGIPEDLHEDVFHSFFTTKEKGKGTGLGLSISRGIIRDHKGEIYLESKEGKGSSFFILLPKVES